MQSAIAELAILALNAKNHSWRGLMAPPTFRVHAGYIIGILLACLIFQTAYDWHSEKSVVELLSFAVGLTSLVLALIAIVQNIVSAPNFTSSIGELASTSRSIENSTRELKAAGDDLSAKLKDIESLPGQMSIFQRDVMERLDQSLMTGGSNRAAHANANTMALIDAGIYSSTPVSSISQYFLYKASKVDRIIEPIEIFSEDQEFVARCILGYAAALKDIGIIDWEYMNGFKNLKFLNGFDPATRFISIINRDDENSAKARIAIDTFFENLRNESGDADSVST